MSDTTCIAVAALAALAVTGCAKIPQGVQPVAGFDVTRYLGTWYEIARLDHRFERGLSNVSATYAARKGGTISVVNRGYDAESGRWKQARAVGRSVGAPDVGSLKVSFFRPFYASYTIIALSPDYSHAVVCGPSHSYLWILARSKQLPQPVLNGLLRDAKAAGFPVDQLIYPKHDRVDDAMPSRGTHTARPGPE